MVAPAAARSALFDNMKLVLITLVVLGHFAIKAAAPFHSHFLTAAVMVIYSFHMAAFIFVSGLFSKNLIDRLPARVDRVMRMLALYVALVLAFYAAGEYWLWPGKASLSFFSQSGLPWYLLAMAEYPVIVAALSRFDRRLMLPAVVALSLLGGLDQGLGDGLAFSRVLTYLPFYLAGYYFRPEMLERFTARWSVRWVTLVGAVAVTAAMYVKTDALRPYMGLLSARRSYHASGVSNWEGLVGRGLLVVIAVFALVAMMAWLPRRVSLLWGAGTRTLQIYVLHYFILYVLWEEEVPQRLNDLAPHAWPLLWIAIVPFIVVILAFPVFGVFVNWADRLPFKPMIRTEQVR